MKLKVFKREGKRAEAYRKEGRIPGILYGPNLESINIYALEKEFLDFYENYESGLFDVEIENQNFKGILQEVQIHPLSDQPIHFDLYIPLLTKKIEAKISLEFIGETPALKTGGVLNIALEELEVEALPTDLPEKIVVDLSKLKEIGQSIYVKDLKIPEKVKVLIDPENPVVSVIEEAKQLEEKLTTGEETANV